MKVPAFFSLVGKLKSLPRTGWVRHGVKDPESVAEHVMRLALLCQLYAPKAGVNTARCIKLALVHDLPEALCGDLVVHGFKRDNLTPHEKDEKERAALEEMTLSLHKEKREEIHSLFEEFSQGKTPEAMLVRDLDIVEMALTALDYVQAKNFDKSLEEFFTEPATRLQTELGKELFAEVQQVYKNLCKP